MLLSTKLFKVVRCTRHYSNEAAIESLKAALKTFLCCPPNIPIAIGKDEFRSKDKGFVVTAPYNKIQDAYRYYDADDSILKSAIEEATKAQPEWTKADMRKRVGIIESAAKMAGTKFRPRLTAAMMCGEAFTYGEADREVSYFIQLLEKIAVDVARTYEKYSGVCGRDGFMTCITPFNSPSISASIIAAPLAMGNTVIWKPSSRSLLSNWVTYEIFREAGIPPGVLCFVPGTVDKYKQVLKAKDLSGVNFVGKKKSFLTIYEMVNKNLVNYTNKPRIIGGHEGKNFMFIDPYCDINCAVRDIIFSAFSFSGQRCSSASILYVPKSRFYEISSMLIQVVSCLCVDHPVTIEIDSYMSSVIDGESYNANKAFIEKAKSDSANSEILAGGHYDEKIGKYIAPTLILSKNFDHVMIQSEHLGPILIMYVYDDCCFQGCLESIARSNGQAISASLFSSNEDTIAIARRLFSNCVFNFNVNCPTIIIDSEQFICEHSKCEGAENFMLNFRK